MSHEQYTTYNGTGVDVVGVGDVWPGAKSHSRMFNWT